jgi:hypothetical protein
VREILLGRGPSASCLTLAKAWPRAALISRKSPKRFKLGFKTVTRPLVRHSSHVLAPGSRTAAVRLRRLARKKPGGNMMVEFVLFLAVAIAPLAAIAVFATGGEDSPGGKKDTDSHKYD